MSEIASRLSGILLMAASLAGAMPCLASAGGQAFTDYRAPVRYLMFN